MNFQLFLLILLTLRNVNGMNFDVNKAIQINLSDSYKVDGSYFGYSLLLQRGPNPMVIVGAPKQNNKTGGAVFACDIFNGSGCIKYSIITSNHGTFNGNFLGASIDGDDNTGNPFIACAPRKVTQQGTGNNINYFLKGSCYYSRNSSNFVSRNIELIPLKNEVPINNLDGQYYYDYAFGQAGIDAVYDGESSSVILGGTGIKNWNGGIVIQSLKTLTDHNIIPKTDAPVVSEGYEYLGYKVGYGVLLDTRFVFGGAPRAENLLGKVKLYNDNRLYQSFKGDEIGSFFGSSVLAADVNDDEYDDLFIGAPMSAGSSYDEGCVYYYKNALSSSVKLTGRNKKGARFGSNIVFLGDIDLDSYNDVAISAPYEDDGVGAVYIFMGGTNGIKTSYSQRLSPLSFLGSDTNVRGFGMGLSRGNDIDKNGHNDLAIGAYKSGHVMIIPTKSVVSFRTTLESNVTSITPSSYQMTLKYCIYYKPRSQTGFLKSVNFTMKLLLDYRVKGPKISIENVTALPEINKCNQMEITIEQAIIDIEPFRFVLNTEVTGDVTGDGTDTIEISIPYAHGCGDDNICQTQIVLNVLTDIDNIVWGLNRVVDVKISAENVGEPGYQCQLLMEIPKQLELRQERKCTFENSTYICPFATKLDSEQEKGMRINFDVGAINENVRSLELSFEIKCLGENFENKETLQIGVVVRNSPYIEGQSVPEDYEYNDDNIDEAEIDIYHTFTLGNFGPSPVKSDVYLLFPIITIDNNDLFHFVEAGGNLRGIHVPCHPTNSTKKFDSSYEVSSVVKSSSSRTVVLDCFGGQFNCMQLMCKGNYLYKSSENAKYTLKFTTNPNLLAKFFRKQEQSKNIIAFVTSAYLFNDTSINDHTSTLVFSSYSSHVPLWVYIVSSVLGVLLLALLIFIFYKCHFFDRRYRDKMNDELLMNQHIEMNSDMPTRSEEVMDEELH